MKSPRERTLEQSAVDGVGARGRGQRESRHRAWHEGRAGQVHFFPVPGVHLHGDAVDSVRGIHQLREWWGVHVQRLACRGRGCGKVAAGQAGGRGIRVLVQWL